MGVYEFKEANKTPHTPSKTTPCSKPQSLIPPLPPNPEVPQSPLKKTAVTTRMTNGESEFAVISHKKADTISLRQTNRTDRPTPTKTKTKTNTKPNTKPNHQPTTTNNQQQPT